MPGSERQAQGRRIEPIPDDLDKFFAWAQDTDRVKEPVKGTLRQIESKYRKKFELVFKREYENVKEEPEESKKLLAERISHWRKILEESETLEEAFAQMPQISKYCELVLAKRDNGLAADGWPDNSPLAKIKQILEPLLEHDEENLRKLKKHKKPASAQTLLLRAVADFLFRHECGPLHALEITRLLIFHDTKSWPNDEKLAKEYRALMDRYGVSRKRKPRKGR